MTTPRRTRTIDPVVVSGARTSRTSDIDDRQRKYLLTMSVRTVAFIVSVVLFTLDLRWEAAVVLALSLLAPIVGVVIANNHVRSAAGRPELYDGDDHEVLPAIERDRVIDL